MFRADDLQSFGATLKGWQNGRLVSRVSPLSAFQYCGGFPPSSAPSILQLLSAGWVPLEIALKTDSFFRSLGVN